LNKDQASLKEFSFSPEIVTDEESKGNIQENQRSHGKKSVQFNRPQWYWQFR
jgi:hypothetical protein